MDSRFLKTMVAVLVAVAQLFASMAAGNVRAAEVTVTVTAAQAACEMSCCKHRVCECEMAPANSETEQQQPAPAAPASPRLDIKLPSLVPLIDLLVLQMEVPVPLEAPSAEVAFHIKEAPLFALHCSYLI